MQNSTSSNAQSETTSYEFMRKVCEQIQQQVQLLLNNLSVDEASSLNPKLLQKCISSTKNSIIKAILSRIPHIVAIQDKFKSLIMEINKELEVQKQKAKDMFCKYQQKILECDRYKMETVHLSQMYQTLCKQNIQLKKIMTSQQFYGSNESQQKSNLKQQINEQKIIKIAQSTQTNNNLHKIIQVQDFNKIEENLVQNKQQKQLFYLQIKQNNQTIEELRQKLKQSQQKIQKLLQQITYYNNMIEQDKQNEQMLKTQLTKLLIDFQTAKIKAQQMQIKNQQQINKLKNEHKLNMSTKQKQKDGEIIQQKQVINELKDKQTKYKDKIEELNNNIKQLNLKIKQFDENLSQKSGYLDQIKQVIDEKNKEIVNLKTKLAQQKQGMDELNSKLSKIDGIAKAQQILQAKYGKKIQLVNKHNKQLQSKVKFYKQQNERLYQAMQQFASKQVKATNKLNTTQMKLEGQKKKIQKLDKLKLKLLNQLGKMKKQMATLKKNLYGEFQLSVTKIIKQFQQNLKQFSQNNQLKFRKKIQSFQECRNNQKQNNERLLNNSLKQYKLLQQKCLQSEQNATKIASTLIQSKNEVQSQINQKQQIIRNLQLQLQKQKQFNDNTTYKLADVVKRYEKVQTNLSNMGNQNNYINGSKSIVKDDDERQLQRIIAEQRKRHINLQYEYQTMLRQ